MPINKVKLILGRISKIFNCINLTITKATINK